MATTYESIAAIFYAASLVLWIYLLMVYFFIYRLNFRAWIIRNTVWKRIVNNTQGGVSVYMLQCYMKVHSMSSGRTWMLAAEMFEDIDDEKENKFMQELTNMFPNIAAIPNPSQRHAAMRLIPEEKYYPYFVTAVMNPEHIDKKHTVASRVYALT